MKIEFNISKNRTIVVIMWIVLLTGIVMASQYSTSPANIAKITEEAKTDWQVCERFNNDEQIQTYWECQDRYRIWENSEEAYIQSKISDNIFPLWAAIIICVIVTILFIAFIGDM